MPDVLKRLLAYLKSNAGAIWLKDVGERAFNTAWQVFAAVFGVAGISALFAGDFDQVLSLGRLAGTAVLAAVLSVVKGAVVAKFNGKAGNIAISPASVATVSTEEVLPLAQAIVDQAAPAPKAKRVRPLTTRKTSASRRTRK